MRPPASESAIGDLEMGWLVQRAAAVADPVGDPLTQHRQGHLRLSEQCAAAGRVAEQRQSAFLVDEAGCLSEEPAEPLRAFAGRDALGPVTLSTAGGDAQLEAAQCVAVRVALPDGVEIADSEIDRLSAFTLRAMSTSVPYCRSTA